MKTRWRMPVAVAASALLALSVYQFAERAQHPQTVTPVPRIAALDTGSLVALQELLRAVVPTDEIIPATDTGSDAKFHSITLSVPSTVSLVANPCTRPSPASNRTRSPVSLDTRPPRFSNCRSQ